MYGHYFNEKKDILSYLLIYIHTYIVLFDLNYKKEKQKGTEMTCSPIKFYTWLKELK